MNGRLEQFKALLRGRLPARITEDHVQSVLSVRRGREALFGRHLFSDPAWDILLELFAARLGGRTMTRQDLAKATGIAKSIVDRWIRALADADLLIETGAPDAGGGSTVALSQTGAAKMTQLVNQWGSAFLAI